MGTSLLTGPAADRSEREGGRPDRVRRAARRRGWLAAALDAVGRRPWLDPLVLTAGIVAVSVLVKLGWPRFTWFGDNSESFFALWHMVGSALREGQWLGFDATAFAGANTVGESAYGVFNPATLANAVLISTFDELARASFVVMTEFLVLLGLAVRSLARSYGARRSAAFTVGVIVPFAGFTFYWGAGNWASGLMAITWVTWTWWAARRYASGAGGPLPLVLMGGLAVTVGSPYSLLGVVVVLVAMAVEVLVARRPGRLVGLVVAGLCIGALAVLTYLPLLGALPVSVRTVGELVGNKSYLAPSLGDLVGASSPSLLPEINAWKSRTDLVPSVYLSWVVLPLLPWLRWSTWGRWGARLGLVVPTVVFLLLTLGPDRIWLFRWPLRLIEYSWVGLAVCLAVLLSAGLARDHLRRRAWGTAWVVAGGFFLAWSSTPRDVPQHLAATAVVGALVAATLVVVHRQGIRALPAMVLAGTLLVTPAQAAVHGWDHKPVVPDLDLGRVSDLAMVREATDDYRGTVLQISSVFAITDPGAVTSGRLVFGHMLAAAGHPTLNRYTGIGFSEYLRGLHMDYRGSVRGADVVDNLFTDVDGYGVPLIDVLGVDTLVIGRAGNEPTTWGPRPGWVVVLRDADRTVLQRAEIPAPGPTVTPGDGVAVETVAGTGNDLRLTVDAPSGGTVLLDRLAWPGYTATTTSGAAVAVGTGPLGLVELTVPPGVSTVDLRYEIPGLRLGLLCLLAAGTLAIGHQVVWLARRKRGPDSPTAPFVT